MITLYDTDNEINVRTSNILNNCENYELVWIDVNNPTEEEFNILRESYDLHSLALEHITNRVKGTKLISYDECSFMILSSINYNISSKNLNFKPVYIFISNKYIITIRYEENHLITKLKNIIKGNRDIFSKGTDFILYSLINEIYDFVGTLLFTIIK